MNKKYLALKMVAALSSPVLLINQAQAGVELMDGRLSIGGAIMQSWQGPIELEGPGRVTTADDEAKSGFHRLRYALHINGVISDRVSVFAELAEEPNDLSTDAGFDPFGIHQDLAWVEIDLGNETKARVGNIISTVQTFIRFSDGAVTQSNPFIGNTPVDMITAEEGIWLLGSRKMASGTRLTWDLGVSSPDFLSDFSKDSGYNIQGRGTINYDNGLSFGAGVFKTDGSVDCSGGVCSRADNAAFNSLIAYGDGENYQFATRGPGNVNHVAIVPGIDALIWQLDAQYKRGPWMVHGFYGQAEDNYSWQDTGGNYRPVSGTFSEVDAEMEYLGLEGQYKSSENTYIAARYTRSENKTGTISSDNELSRWQLAAGYWFDERTLVKAEYVKQEEEALSGGQNVNGTGKADWDGFLIEASFTF